jgi:putative transposase
MTLIDEFTRRCLAIRVARRINAIGVIKTLADAMLFEGLPTYIRSDNGPEMVAKVLREWLTGLGTRNLYIEPGSPWENGYCESFNGKLRDECLTVSTERETFDVCLSLAGNIMQINLPTDAEPT